MNNEILLSIAAVLSGFVLLVWGAERFVHGAAALARNLGISPLVIGLTIVGIGTSAPEILVSAVAAWQGNPSMGVGNALGSNIANIALVLGITALISPLKVNSQTLRREYPVMFLIMIIALMLLLDGQFTRVDGLILLMGLVIVLKWMISLGMKEKKDPLELEYEHEIPHIATGKAIFWLIVGLILLLFSSRILVWGAVNIAQALGVSDLIIGLTVVAIGTSMPELAASIMSALKKEHDIAIGNIIGSNIFNMLAVLGLPGLIAPYTLDPAVLTRDFPWMIGLSIALFVFAYGFRGEGRINRWEGLLLLCSYFVYLGVLYFDVSKNMHLHSS